MKKILITLFLVGIVGYLFYQNGSLWVLKLLAIKSGSGFTATNVATAGSNTQTYKDGTFTGSSENAFYGNIQVQATIQNGKITNVQFLQYPNDRTRSIAINTLAMPHLNDEAIQAQSADVNIVSGATDTSNAFMQSLASALSQAK